MKLNILVFLVSCLGSTFSLKHGGHIASFKYQFSSGAVELEFRLEKSILDHFDLSKNCENYDTATALCLTRYIDQHTSFAIDGEELDFELQGARRDNDFFILELVARHKTKSFKRLSIQNQCFLEFDAAFENRIILWNEDEPKSYLLNNDNRLLNIKLGNT